MHGILTEVSALNGAVVEGDTEVVTCLPQLRNGNAIWAADYSRLVVVLPLSAAVHTHTRTKRNEQICRMASIQAHTQALEKQQDAITDAAPLTQAAEREERVRER